MPSVAAARTLLEVCGVSKQFGGLSALDAVTLAIRRGEIYGLIGPNGAGKTTLFNIITGLYTPSMGRVTLDGSTLTGMKPHQVVQAGLARTFQNIRLFANMTALENIMVGRHPHSHAGVVGAILRTRATCAEEAAIREQAYALLADVGITAQAGKLAKQLCYGDQRRLEIARALATEPKLLALDEPAAGMNAAERHALGELLLRLRGSGLTLLLIEHDVGMVMGLCDRVAVLDSGKKIAEDSPQIVRLDPTVIAAYLGTETDAAP